MVKMLPCLRKQAHPASAEVLSGGNRERLRVHPPQSTEPEVETTMGRLRWRVSTVPGMMRMLSRAAWSTLQWEIR